MLGLAMTWSRALAPIRRTICFQRWLPIPISREREETPRQSAGESAEERPMPWEQQPAYQRIERHPKRVSRNCRKHESESAGRGYLDFHLVLLAITCVMRMLRQSDR